MTIAHYCMYTWVRSFKGVVIVSETPHKLLSCELWLLTGCCERCSTGGECLLKTQAVTRSLTPEPELWEGDHGWAPGALVRVVTPEWIEASVLQQTGAGTQQLRPAEAAVTCCGGWWPLYGPASLCPRWSQLSAHLSLHQPLLASTEASELWGLFSSLTISRVRGQSHSRQQNVQRHRERVRTVHWDTEIYCTGGGKL